jgi:uncharacterized membrane protein (DUF485 family)
LQKVKKENQNERTLIQGALKEKEAWKERKEEPRKEEIKRGEEFRELQKVREEYQEIKSGEEFRELISTRPSASFLFSVFIFNCCFIESNSFFISNLYG